MALWSGNASTIDVIQSDNRAMFSFPKHFRFPLFYFSVLENSTGRGLKTVLVKDRNTVISRGAVRNADKNKGQDWYLRFQKAGKGQTRPGKTTRLKS